MKRILLCIIAALAALGSLSAADKKENIMDRKVVYNMGEVYGKDSSKVSHRSLPKRLVMPKGAMGVGFQFLWAQMDASNLQALAMVSGATGKAGFGNIAPSFMYAYANNNAIGVRLSYSMVDVKMTSGQVKLLTDDLTLKLDALDTKMNVYGGSVFNRSWFGLDKNGRFALFADVDLGYAYSDTKSSSGKAITHSIGLTFSPGLEIFVMNNLSLYFSLSFANISYDNSKSYRWVEGVEGVSDGHWDQTGDSNRFNFKVRFNIIDLHLGLAYYF